jgi:hypothetical protein
MYGGKALEVVVIHSSITYRGDSGAGERAMRRLGWPSLPVSVCAFCYMCWLAVLG